MSQQDLHLKLLRRETLFFFAFGVPNISMKRHQCRVQNNSGNGRIRQLGCAAEIPEPALLVCWLEISMDFVQSSQPNFWLFGCPDRDCRQGWARMSFVFSCLPLLCLLDVEVGRKQHLAAVPSCDPRTSWQGSKGSTWSNVLHMKL